MSLPPMQMRGLYLITLKSGAAYFGILESRDLGVISLGGYWICFVPGFFAEAAIETIYSPSQPEKGESETDWVERTNWKATSA